ncbi:hypothetical protein M2273_000611 [Mucilaginibacter lappiensis]
MARNMLKIRLGLTGFFCLNVEVITRPYAENNTRGFTLRDTLPMHNFTKTQQ